MYDVSIVACPAYLALLLIVTCFALLVICVALLCSGALLCSVLLCFALPCSALLCFVDVLVFRGRELEISCFCFFLLFLSPTLVVRLRRALLFSVSVFCLVCWPLRMEASDKCTFRAIVPST